ncbi:MAG TPA: MFS transporter, partial [Rhizomicrobium sp.]
MSVSAPAILYQRRDFAFFTSGRFLSTVAMQMQSVAIGWQIYSLTNSAFALGLVGLCQFAPMFLLTLPAGDIADRVDQRRVLAIAMLVEALASALFLALSLAHVAKVWPFYSVLVLFGAARGFAGPSGQSLVAFLVPEEKLARSIALSSSVFTTAVIAGPALGGFLYAFGAFVTYSVCCFCFLFAATLTIVLGGRRRAQTVSEGSRLERVAEGVRFVRSRPVILGAISLDLFAVLLGGAVALLPIYARDILHAGPVGLGLLRAAPAVGAALVALTLARFPIERHTGIVMFSAVGLFGIATIVFGLSKNFPLSIAALFILGASDMIS